MIIKLNKLDVEKFNRLLETKDYNNEVANYLNDNIINEVLEDEDLIENKIKQLNISKYQNNEYFKNIKVKEITYKNYEIKYLTYQKNQCFLYDDIKVNSNDYYLINNCLGYFSDNFKYLSIAKDNQTWMSIIPHEIHTMEIDKNKLTKHIYVFGLGLGYFPYIYEKYVDKITIIEKDKNIIELFNKFIFPNFPNKEKYEIVNDDARNYINKISKDDFVFIDLYHDVKDGLDIYIEFNKLLNKHNNKMFWIEESLLMGVRNLLISLLEEEYYHPNEFDYSKANSNIDLLINKMHQYLLNKKISSFLEIKNLLSNENLKMLISNI